MNEKRSKLNTLGISRSRRRYLSAEEIMVEELLSGHPNAGDPPKIKRSKSQPVSTTEYPSEKPRQSFRSAVGGMLRKLGSEQPVPESSLDNIQAEEQLNINQIAEESDVTSQEP